MNSAEGPGKDAQTSLLRPGRVMFSRYALERILGRGGMGVVWRARDRKLDRPVALKFLPDIFLSDPAARDDLKRETRRSLELTHPNIVRIYDFVEDDEAAAISLEYIDGATLTQLRIEHRQRCFEVGGLDSWVADLCRALDYAHHTAHAVHRDLKPSNLMVTSRGVLKVADFGIACSLHNTAACISAWNTSKSGTLSYMSPQQLRGDLPAMSDDIYAVGATLYEALTSKPPFYAGDISLQIRETTPDSMELRRQKLGLSGEPIPAAWEETILACLEKEPRNRPTSAADIARRLAIDFHGTTRPDDYGAGERTVMVRSAPGESTPSRPVSPLATALATNLAVARKWVAPRKKQVLGAAVALAIALLIPALWPDTKDADVSMSGPEKVNVAIPAVAGPSPAAVALPPAVSAEPGGVMVKTNPPGAAVTVDDVGGEPTPASIRGLTPGDHVISIQMAGFEPVVIPTAVRSGHFTDLGMIGLQRSTGTLQLTTDPEDTQYTLFAAESDQPVRNGKSPDSIPNLPTGSYRVRLEREGWPVAERTIEVERQATQIVSHSFGTGTLQVTTEPPGARVLVAGRELGRTPLSATLPNGAYQSIAAQLEGYEEAFFDAAIAADETLVLPPIGLKPLPAQLVISTKPVGMPFQLFEGAVEVPDAQPVSAGNTPATVEGLPSGPHRIIFGGGRWPSYSMALEVNERGVTEFHRDFAHGTVKVDSKPPGAEVFEGEESLGVTPLDIPFPEGSHTITADLNDRTARPRTVKVVADKAASVRFDFNTSTSTASRARKPRKKVNDSALTKIGRSIKTFFTGDKTRR